MLQEVELERHREAGDCSPTGVTNVNLRTLFKLTVCGFVLSHAVFQPPARAESDAGGPDRRISDADCLVVYSAKDHVFSHPAVGFHFIDTAAVIGNIETFSITEGFANRAEVGYTRRYTSWAKHDASAGGVQQSMEL